MSGKLLHLLHLRAVFQCMRDCRFAKAVNGDSAAAMQLNADLTAAPFDHLADRVLLAGSCRLRGTSAAKSIRSRSLGLRIC
ncbi:MAG: hypothetical protein ABI619_10255 [Betaproteobacteria bacterium]